MKKYINKVLNDMAKDHNYSDVDELLYDYGIIPSVRMPKHNKWEFIKMLPKYIKPSK